MAKPRGKDKDKERKPGKKDKDKARRGGRRKVCTFCVNHIDEIDYKDLQLVRRFVNEKSKISARRSSGACAKHQRRVAQAVKRAREMALIPYCTSR